MLRVVRFVRMPGPLPRHQHIAEGTLVAGLKLEDD
jgi:hypothetical protein